MEQLEHQELSEVEGDVRLWELLSVAEQVRQDFYDGDDAVLV